jgi:hypothetical protein
MKELINLSDKYKRYRLGHGWSKQNKIRPINFVRAGIEFGPFSY